LENPKALPDSDLGISLLCRKILLAFGKFVNNFEFEYSDKAKVCFPSVLNKAIRAIRI